MQITIRNQSILSGQIENIYSMSSKYPKISIVILNWHHWSETLKCLKSVLLDNYLNYDCIIVDNGSVNNSEQNIIQWLEHQKEIVKIHSANDEDKAYDTGRHGRRCCGVYEYYNEDKSQSPINISLLQTGFNFGYSGGNNIGIERALQIGCDYVVILNSDTIVNRGFILEIARAALDSGASIIGGLIKDSSGRRILASGENLLKVLLSLGFRPKNHKGPWWHTGCVNGSAMMLSRAMLVQRKNQLGYYLNPHFFMYCEEIEIGFWCKAQGLKSIISNNSTVFHKVGGSSAGADSSMPFYYSTRNRMIIAKKYLKGPKLCLFYVVFFLLRIMRSSYYLLLGKKDIALRILLGLLDGVKDVTGPKL
ncbi:MAG: glycosyltransferase family 2 protein [Mobilitalea sp.]